MQQKVCAGVVWAYKTSCRGVHCQFRKEGVASDDIVAQAVVLAVAEGGEGGRGWVG